MAAKTIDTRAPLTIVELKAKVMERYTSVPFDHPNYDGAVEVAMLKSGEREHVHVASEMGTEEFSPGMWNRLSVAYGLVTPDLASEVGGRVDAAGKPYDRGLVAMKIAEALKEYPDDFITPIADKVWDLTTNYRKNRETAADGPAPFVKVSGLSSGSSIASTSPPTSSKDGATSG
jgi:hypothetical protein